ncbi:hypothetical protein FNF31_05398 [Cafeteria roenbergensis]|uniref:Uncharacterized protein n=1 Tax=Cafeteria roenbergensis TaxID=33653 RepID=A0A5A8D1G3_CAFRO|nr:hypothetical protein FNF31_05398 [Cafeteria roenbergensis]
MAAEATDRAAKRARDDWAAPGAVASAPREVEFPSAAGAGPLAAKRQLGAERAASLAGADTRPTSAAMSAPRHPAADFGGYWAPGAYPGAYGEDVPFAQPT